MPPDQRKPSPSVVGEQLITKKGVFGIVQGHQDRHLAINPKTGGLFVGVGSSGNIGVEPEVKAAIQRFDPDGTNQTTFASGTRNPTALAFQPGSGDLYAVVQERDGLGDNLVPDFLTRVEKGAFHGWPHAYIGHNPQPGFASLRPHKVQASVTPDLLFQAHSSPAPTASSMRANSSRRNIAATCSSSCADRGTGPSRCLALWDGRPAAARRTSQFYAALHSKAPRKARLVLRADRRSGILYTSHERRASRRPFRHLSSPVTGRRRFGARPGDAGAGAARPPCELQEQGLRGAQGRHRLDRHLPHQRRDPARRAAARA